MESLLRDYEPHNIFNADETGLFFKYLPDRTLTFKDEKYHSGKHSKERITILVCANMSGTEKRKMFVIGKSIKHRCFSGVKSLPVDYAANKKAWTSAKLFANQLIELDKDMTKQKRQFILFIDNCSAHKNIPPLKSVTIKFLPPNTTSKLQSLDPGNNNFKTAYRHEVVRKIITDIEESKTSSINILEVVRMADKAWRNISSTTIANCFKSCGFVKESLEEVMENVEKFSIEEDIETE